MRASTIVLSLLCGGLALTGCKKATPSVYQEVLDQGADRFFGVAKVKSQSTSGNETTYNFDPTSGPICMLGDPYNVTTRNTGSDGLFIFLQGGGACWSQFCLAVTTAEPGIPSTLDVLDPTNPLNPMAQWSTVYLPYCDGSLFVGDSTANDSQSPPRTQHGLQNLSAALDVAAKEFPNPKRIVLAGSSGGGYGSIMATLLVRAKYPGIDILVFNDSGIGLGKPGDPMFIDQILNEFNASNLIPESCTDCTGAGHITPLVGWELQRDPQLKIAAFSSYQDYVISQIYLQIDPTLFQTTLIAQTGTLHDAYNGRYQRFLVSGTEHTTLLGGVDGLVGDSGDVQLPPNFLNEAGNIKIGSMYTTEIGGVTIATWFQAMVDGTPAWTDMLDPQN